MTTSLLHRFAVACLVLAGLTASFAASAHAAVPPASVDLSAIAPPVADQGSLHSDAAWATGYYLRGWYARRDGYYPGTYTPQPQSYAPMYTYAQIAQGHDNGSTLQQNLDILKAQGIDSRADYTQGDVDYTSQATAAERAKAASARIAGYTIIQPGTLMQKDIEFKMAGGDPVALNIPVYPEFTHASASRPLVTAPISGETSRGLRAVAAFKYDSNGVWVENSQGTGYGLNGWAELSWDFVNHYAVEMASIVPLSPLERFYDGSYSVFDRGSQTHWVTTKVSDVDGSWDAYSYEATLGGLFASSQPGTVPLYGCEVDETISNGDYIQDHFVSPSSTCEGRNVLGLEGYLYTSPQPSVAPVQIYRCYHTVNGHGDHFVSTDAHCEGFTTEASLGYLHA
jgi:hypothetical protein